MGFYALAENLLLSDVNLRGANFSEKEISILSKLDVLLEKTRMLQTRLYNASTAFPDTTLAWFRQKKQYGEFFSGSDGLSNTLFDENILFASDFVLSYYCFFKNNRYLLDAYSLLKLERKELHDIPFIVSEYHRLGIAVLPDYIQEAIVVSGALSKYSNLVSNKTLSKVRRVLFDYDRLQRGLISFKYFASSHEKTFIFHFLTD
jgi:hypothetical protein